MWSILRCAAGQDMVLASAPKHGKFFYAHLPQPGMVSTIDIPFRFSVLNRARVPGCQTRSVAPTPKHWSKDPFSPPPPPHPGSQRAQE